MKIILLTSVLIFMTDVAFSRPSHTGNPPKKKSCDLQNCNHQPNIPIPCVKGMIPRCDSTTCGDWMCVRPN